MLQDKAALVTGGASGIGEASARRLAAEGARVAVLDLNESAGGRVASEVGGTFIACDVTDSKALALAFAKAADEIGALDVVHLNAGVLTPTADIASLTDEQYAKVRSVNIDHVVYGTREAVRAMQGRGGAIVATASLAGIISYPPDPIYGLTKHAVVGFVRALGLQLMSTNITINAVCPGIVNTPMVGDEGAKRLREAGFPMLEPEDIAEAVVRAVTSGATAECWVCQPGREPLIYEFRGVPGPRTVGSEGKVPPLLSR